MNNTSSGIHWAWLYYLFIKFAFALLGYLVLTQSQIQTLKDSEV